MSDERKEATLDFKDYLDNGNNYVMMGMSCLSRKLLTRKRKITKLLFKIKSKNLKKL